MPPTAISVIGVGRMGLPIARHLHRAGSIVTVFDSNDERMLRAGRSGLATAPTAAAAAASADVLITVLPGAPEVDDAMLGAGALVEVLRPGSCWLDLTSNDPRTGRRVAAAASSRGIEAVGAPMGGGVEAAEAAELAFFVGGAPAAQERVAPILGILSRQGGIRITGHDIGSAYSAKLLINLLWFGQVAAVTETLLLGQRLGLEPTALRQLIAGSAGDSVFAQRHLDALLNGDYLTGFGLRGCVDELDVLASLAAEHDSPFEVSGTVARLHTEALAAFGDVDGEMLVARLLEDRAGRRLQSDAG